MSEISATPQPRKRRFQRLRQLPFPIWLILFGLFGGIVGLGSFTFIHAKGYSYLADEAAACANCHIMRDVYDAWNRGSHKAVAVCNDCHVPHDSIISKYAVKAIDGIKHSAAFTLNNFHEPIRITGMNYDIAQQNCLRCHGELTALIGHVSSRNPTDCLRCHANVGHEP